MATNNADVFLGVDLGGTSVKIGLLTATGQILAQGNVITAVEQGPEALVVRVAGRLRELAAEQGVAWSRVRGLGIGSPGPLSCSQGRIVRAGNLPGFDGFPLRGALSAALQAPAVFGNDANVACWGEYWLGAGHGVRGMVLFTLGTGVGGGIVYQGELVNGVDGNGGELGHMIVARGGRPCTCGQKGCLEAYASASHTARRAEEELAAGRESSLQELYRTRRAVECKDVFEHAAAGDALADEIVEGTVQALGQACINMRHALEPQRVVLAGGMIGAGEMLRSRVEKAYQGLLWLADTEPLEIRLASLGGDAGLIGAAGLAVHEHEKGGLYDVGV